jgi:hypothetical protein
VVVHLPENHQVHDHRQDLHLRHHAMNALLAEVEMIVVEPHDMYQRVVKSVIRAGFGQRRKNETSQGFVQEYLNQISQKM